ncbi:MAG: (2Fe-2S)-binding protein [Planctomycetes bacterium]|nr:(2Fe-2S)-binding protein [Planctomycetota bacterium]
MVKITVNGREVEADPKQPLIAACHGHDVDVPHYCYHPGLSTVGSCRMCQVEVQQGTAPGRVMVACRTYPAEGMVVSTESEKSHATRRECLEFLLKNHPLDCPICDKAGECDLQDFTYQEGQATGRSKEPRRPLEKRHSLGDVIVLDQERCILCSRCVRFFEEVPKKAQLTVASLGSRSVIATFADQPLTGNYQGNIADLCPVGALTLKGFRFQARVWNLVKMASTCAECSRGCSIQVEVLRGGDVKRFRPRENAAVNRWWMCDTGRFAFDHVNAKDRLVNSLVRDGHGLAPRSIEDGIAAVRALLDAHSDALFVASPFCTVEEGASIQALAKRRGTTALFVAPGPNGLKDALLHTGDPCPNRRGLTELGLQPIEPKELAKKLASSKAAVLFGERVVELAGAAAIAALPTSTALAVFDCKAPDAAACTVAIGVPTSVERTGTWINVDGQKGPIAAVKPAPAGVRALARHLAALDLRAEAARS